VGKEGFVWKESYSKFKRENTISIFFVFMYLLGIDNNFKGKRFEYVRENAKKNPASGKKGNGVKERVRKQERKG
jgi:hypothetical protein